MRNTQITACLFFGITLGFHAALQAAAPTAGFTASPTSGEAPLSVAFDASATADSDGIVTSYEWNINGQAIELGTVHADYEMTDASVEFIESATVTRRLVTIEFKTDGSYQVGLQVTDDSGESDAATPQTITVGGGANQEPVAALMRCPPK